MLSAATPPDTQNPPELYRALDALMVVQLRSVVARSVEDYAAVLAAPHAGVHLALALVLDDDVPQFAMQPAPEEFVVRVVSGVDLLCGALQAVVPLDVWVSGGFAKLPTAPEPGFVAAMRLRVRTTLLAALEAPLAYLRDYDRFAHLLPGGAADTEMHAFLQEEHSFEECLAVCGA